MYSSPAAGSMASAWLKWVNGVGEIAFVLHPTVSPELYELIMIPDMGRERGGEMKSESEATTGL